MARIKIIESGLRAVLRDYIRSSDLRSKGQRVLDTAQANAPVFTGAYKAGLHLEQADDGIRIAGSTDHDIYVERDTGNLVRALDSAGG